MPRTQVTDEGRPAPAWAWDRRAFFVLPILMLPIPFLVNEYILYVVNLILVYVLVGVGFNIIAGNLGQLAFASAAVWGIGAYTTAILMAHLAVPFWVAMAAASLAGALAGALAAVPALRGIRRYYLAIITLAFGELMRWLYIHGGEITEGSSGLGVPLPTLFGLPLATDTDKFYFFLAVVVLMVWATSNLLRSRVGRAFEAIKDNETAAAAVGIPTARYIVLAFAWGGFVMGVSGALYAALVRHVTPEAFNLIQLLVHFGIIMVGGLGNLAGSIIGATLLTAAPEFFREWPGFEELFFAILIILVLIFLPNGIVSLLARWIPLFRERYYRE